MKKYKCYDCGIKCVVEMRGDVLMPTRCVILGNEAKWERESSSNPAPPKPSTAVSE